MPVVHFTNNLRRFFPGLDKIEAPASDVAALLRTIDKDHPGLLGYLVEDDGSLRKHVNVFVDGELIHDRKGLSDPVAEGSEVHVIQALSGG